MLSEVALLIRCICCCKRVSYRRILWNSCECYNSRQ